MKSWWSRQRARMDGLLEEYGRVAIVTYVTLCVTMFAALWAAASLGFEVDSAAGGMGSFGAACLAYQGLKPLRIGVAIVLIPLVAAAVRRVRPTRPSPAPGDEAAEEER